MRRTKIVTVTDPKSRDTGKQYVLTEMPASQAERWAARAFFALGNSNLDVGAAQGGGWAGIAVLGVTALMKLPFDDALPLMDEMFTCIKYMPDPRNQPEIIRNLVEDDIEEVSTRLLLRQEVLQLHTGFSLAGVLSTLISKTDPADLSNTQTSREASA